MSDKTDCAALGALRIKLNSRHFVSSCVVGLQPPEVLASIVNAEECWEVLPNNTWRAAIYDIKLINTDEAISNWSTLQFAGAFAFHLKIQFHPLQRIHHEEASSSFKVR